MTQKEKVTSIRSHIAYFDFYSEHTTISFTTTTTLSKRNSTAAINQ